MIKGFINNWPQKLGALTLAILLWYFVTFNDSSVSQRGLIIPVTIEGLSDNQIASGVPDSVEIEVSGQSNRINRLRPENFDAGLDLSGITGEYQERIDVLSPQGIRLITVKPAEALGTVEVISSKTVRIELTLRGNAPKDGILNLDHTPSLVSVQGRTSVLEQVQSALAMVESTLGEQTAKIFAVDDSGQPVTDVTLIPDSVQVNVAEVPILHTKRLDLIVSEPNPDPLLLGDFTISQTSLQVAGPKEVLDNLETVIGLVELDTDNLNSGEYTLDVKPRLPEQVRALETVQVQFQITTPTEDSRNNDEPNGEENDLSNTPIRGPDSSQDSEPSDAIQ